METEISNSHKMVIAVLRIFYEKQKTKIVYYRIHKILNIDTNKAELVNFTDSVLSVHASIKTIIYPCKQFSFHDKRSKRLVYTQTKILKREN